MDTNVVLHESLALLKKSKIALLGTQSQDGYPYIKAMMNLKNGLLLCQYHNLYYNGERVGLKPFTVYTLKIYNAIGNRGGIEHARLRNRI
ncbi:MAG: hypothetical protein JW795_13560 [Chitinivibrionales bacterium]|nr:hypothetical protein [Chitinivibrionales bacterium]